MSQGFREAECKVKPNPAFERDSPRSVRAPQFYVRHRMTLTPIIAVTSVLVAIAVYAFLSFRRFPCISSSKLLDYSLIEDKRGPNYGLALLLLLVWASSLLTLDALGYAVLAGVVWGGTVALVLIFGYRKYSGPVVCSTCHRPTQTFRKEIERNVPAIYYVHVCHACKQYQVQLVIVIGSDA